MTVVYGIDAGGTHTWISIEVPGRPAIHREVGSISRTAVGVAAARECLRETFEIVARSAAGQVSVGWLASASIVAETAREELSVIRGLLSESSGLLAVSNDAVPMLLAPPLGGHGAVVVAGTGSGFIGCDEDTVLQLGGHDYLGADQGSAFDIGSMGLRAALRAHDGIGPPSLLPESLSLQAGRDIASEARRLAALPFPKQAVARLAPAVIRCWLDRDNVAAGVVSAAVEALAAGASQLRQALRLTAANGTVLAGGLVTGCTEFAAALQVAIEQACGPHQLTVCTDPVATVLWCARRFAESRDRSAIGAAYLGRYVWLVGPAC